MKPGEKKLSDEDRILWNRIVKTAKPLKGKKVTLISEPEPADMRCNGADIRRQNSRRPCPGR